MSYAITFMHILFPLINLSILLTGIITRRSRWLVAALWLSLVAVIWQYQSAQGEILGSYFDYKESFLYSVSLLVLLTGIVYLLWGYAREMDSNWIRPLFGLVVAASATAVMLLLTNLWINARFIENRMPDSPVLQIGSFQKPDYCHFQYLFYTVSKEGELSYLCPNYYGLLPSVGTVQTMPDYVLKLLPKALQNKLQPKKQPQI